MLLEFKKGSSTAHTCKSICAVYGKGAVSERTCQKWFKRCRDGNFSLSDEPRLGQPSNVNENWILEEVLKNPRRSVVELEEALGMPKSTVYIHLKKIGMVSQYDAWVPHILSDKHLKNRVSACVSLLGLLKDDPFFQKVMRNGSFTTM